MLAPENRQIYLEEIQPPVGYELDRAVATTYSLDLLSLLMTPLSLALFSAESPRQIWNNPAAVTESLRKTSDKLSVFCQQGQIKIPIKDNKLYNYLEPIVHDVQPPKENGVFHPKIWVLRFVCPGEAPYYRFLCLSRNLTFDNSWDTLLSLEGELREDRSYAFANNHPLGDFIAVLPELAVHELNERVKKDIDLISEEIRRVEFVTPEHFTDQIDFVPLGIGKNNSLEQLDNYNKMLIVSPFLTFSKISSLFEKSPDNMLISRGETLDQLTQRELEKISEISDIYIMDQAAERPDQDDIEESAEKQTDFTDLSGLHAKLYILEKGWDAKVYTGSANATRAGLTGQNVEFMVGLKGKKSRVGIEPFLGDEDKETSLLSILQHYHITEKKAPDKEGKLLEQKLNQMKNKLSQLQLKVEIKEKQDDFELKIMPENNINADNLFAECYCYPITLKNSKKQVTPLLSGEPIIYPQVSLSALTGFVAFELQVKTNNKQDTKTARSSFVFNLETTGMPKERDKKILQEIISSKERFLQYLMILLSEDNDFLGGLEAASSRGQKAGEGSTMIDFPLLEELVKAYSRNPAKIENVKELVVDLTETEEGRDILPDNFYKVWSAFCEPKKGGESETND